jgi:hypothetical protein
VRTRAILAAGLLAAASLALTLTGCGGDDGKPAAHSTTAATVAAKPKKADAATAWTAIHAAVPTSKYSLTVTEATDGNHLLGRPGQYMSAVKFIDTRINADDVASNEKGDVGFGGGIEVFASHDDAQARADYIQKVTKGIPVFAEYDYVHGKVLVRVSHYLTPAQAADYDKAAAGL